MRIGADHGAVEATGRTFDLTGEVAQLTGDQATGYSAEMAAGVDEITARLKSDFAATATQLTERVAAHARQLDATDWAGSSKEQALAAEQALTVQVQQVLQQANEAVDQFGLQLHQRAETFRDAIEGGFLAAMREADQAYKEMAQASRTFLSNLQAADQTIRFGG
jgi:exonuclease VII large subunit